MNSIKKDPASFRDSDGYVFEHEGTIYRAINESYLGTYAKLKSSGFYQALLEEELIIPHEEEKTLPLHIINHPLIIRPLQINPISYPYEWSFEQYKDAALCTLRIQMLALMYGFNLKDATPFNIQFIDGKPKLIDTLSFFTGDKNIWIAYRQFCECFLAPLALMAYSDHDFVRLGQIYHDGIPLRLASKLLPHRTWLKPSLCIHIHLHARAQKSAQSHRGYDPASRDRQKRLLLTLQRAIQSLPKSKSFLSWINYYSDDCVHPEYLKNKMEIIENVLRKIKPHVAVDIGCNTGAFSKIASTHSETVIALDRDPSSVESLYRFTKQEKIKNLIPLVMNILNPSPSLGWMSRERRSFLERIKPDVIMMLGISHHLAGQANITFNMLAEFCLKARRYVIIEFIPDTDTQFGKLFASRMNHFNWYTSKDFLKAFAGHFVVKDVWKVEPTNRTIYLFKKRNAR